jgi:hypothetical protein
VAGYHHDVNPRWARPWFAATAICAVVGIVVSIVTAHNNVNGFFDDPIQRGANALAFFTVQSNIIVAVTTGLLAVRLDWPSALFRVVRLIGLVAITVTGIVYHVALASVVDLAGWEELGNQLVHTAVPVLTVVGWLAFGPRRAISARIAWMSLAFPVAWLAFTLIRGHVVGFYPYPFIDVRVLGYGEVVLNCVWVSLLMLALAGGAVTLDRRLSRTHDPDPDPTLPTVTSAPTVSLRRRISQGSKSPSMRVLRLEGAASVFE